MDFDIAIIGSGFAGSLMAMIAQRIGFSVVLLERGQHPRFAIGESSTPLANLYLEQLARRYALPRLLPLTAWGPWQRERPELACGLKRGFSFFHHQLDQPFSDDARRRHHLLVAASPRDDIADTQWFRADFDQLLVDEARRCGVVFFDRTHVRLARAPAKKIPSHEPLEFDCERDGTKFSVRARFVIDASGPRGFLHRTLELPEIAFPNLPRTEALYSHFCDVRPLEATLDAVATPPYEVENAAVHHVFEDGWIWLLRFNNGITSAGVVATERLARQLNFSKADAEKAWRRILARLPTLQRQFRNARAVQPFFLLPHASFRSGRVVGKNWALLPSTAGFVDPLLSTGFPLALLGIARLAEILESSWATDQLAAKLKTYERQTFAELDTTEQLVSALYANFSDFEIFAALSQLYFAAASFSEATLRLKQTSATRLGFLLQSHPSFSTALSRCCRQARRPSAPKMRRSLLTNIHRAIEPINVAGLGDPARRNWFPVRGDDLLEGAGKLGVNKTAVKNFLQANGF